MSRKAALALFGNWIGDGVVAYLISKVIEATSEPSPLRGQVILLMWPLVVIGGTVITAIWLWRSTAPVPPAPRDPVVTSAPLATHPALPPIVEATEDDILGLRDTDLEAAFFVVQSKAKVLLAADVELSFMKVRLTPQIEFYFDCWSATANKSAVLVATRVAILRGETRRGPRQGFRDDNPPTPWRGDPMWVDLIRASWLRERPFTGDAQLFYRKATSWQPGSWLINYDRATAGVIQAEHWFRLDDGKLVETDVTGK